MERIDITNAGDVFIIKWILSRNCNTPPVRVRVSVNDDDDERPYLSAATVYCCVRVYVLYSTRLVRLWSCCTVGRLLDDCSLHLPFT